MGVQWRAGQLDDKKYPSRGTFADDKADRSLDSGSRLCALSWLMDCNYLSPVVTALGHSLLFHLLCDSAVNTFVLKPDC